MNICETARLTIRPLSLTDVPELTAILSDPEVMKYSIRGVCDEVATRAFVEWCMTCYHSHGVGPWALIDKQSLVLVGFCGVGPEMVFDVEELGLGYRLARRYWNKGLATEAARAVVDYAFEQKQIESVIAVIEPDHVASINVAEKSGFQSFNVIDFHDRRVRLYRLFRDQWPVGHKPAYSRP